MYSGLIELLEKEKESRVNENLDENKKVLENILDFLVSKKVPAEELKEMIRSLVKKRGYLKEVFLLSNNLVCKIFF